MSNPDGATQDDKTTNTNEIGSVQDSFEPNVCQPAELTEADEDPAKIKKTRNLPSGRQAVIEAIFAASTTSAERLFLKNSGSPVVGVVRVPDSAWVSIAESYIESSLAKNWLTITRDGKKRSHDKSDVANDEVSTALSNGCSVLGIAANTDLLPATLIAGADQTICLERPNGKVVEDAIRRFTGTRLHVSVPDDIVAGLDFFDLVAAFRPKSKPSAIVARLQAASNARGVASTVYDDVPALKTAVEYGAARDWGLALAQDIRDYRAGLIPWSAIDRGAVLYSDPGLGKSLFARILAAECRLPLVITSIAEIFATTNGNLDGCIKGIRDVFTRASTLAPAIMFVDELDALPSRKTLSGRNADWWLPVITDFLLQLDSAVSTQREGVIVLGATNYIDNIDYAILRPGRLERVIHIKPPDLAGTVNILRFHVRDSNFADADLIDIGRRIEGSTGAEIMMLVRDARRLARQKQRKLSIDDLWSVAVPHDNDNPDHLFRKSIHEAGHAVLAIALGVGILKKVVVIRENDESGGRTQVEWDSRFSPTRSQIEDHVTMMLAGRAAEKIIVGEESVAAGGSKHSDLAKATRLIAGLHASAGLGQSLLYLASLDEAREYMKFDFELRRHVEEHLQKLQQRAFQLVEKHRTAIEAVAAVLRDRRYLSGEAVRELFSRTESTRLQEASQLFTN